MTLCLFARYTLLYLSALPRLLQQRRAQAQATKVKKAESCVYAAQPAKSRHLFALWVSRIAFQLVKLIRQILLSIFEDVSGHAA